MTTAVFSKLTTMARCLALAGLCLAVSAAITTDKARADFVVWEEAHSGIMLSYPDSWQLAHEQKPDEAVRILAPRGQQAMCRVRIRDDGRYAIFPPRYDDEVQLISFSTNFWKDYLAEVSEGDIVLYRVENRLGLGRGFASHARASYELTGHRKTRYNALLAVSHYHNKIYILECRARARDYARLQTMFHSIMASFDMPKRHHEALSGNYRNFLRYNGIRFTGEYGLSNTRY